MKNHLFFLFLFSFLWLTPSAEAQNQEFLPQIKAYLGQNSSLSPQDMQQLVVRDSHFASSTQAQMLYVDQYYKGVPLQQAVGSFAIKNNKIVAANHRFIEQLAQQISSSQANLSPIEAVNQAAAYLKLEGTATEIIEQDPQKNTYLIAQNGLSKKEIPVKLVYQSTEAGYRMAYNLRIFTLDDLHWWSVNIDAATGAILHVNDYLLHCQFEEVPHTHEKTDATPSNFTLENQQQSLVGNAAYRVFPMPIESPSYGNRVLVNQPADAVASPFGWHDIDGASGNEFTSTRGNNVFAADSRDGNFGNSPDGGSNLVFDFPLNLNQDPKGYLDASVTNLFYWSNLAHDVWYQYGFDEASGNFQRYNYTNQGLANDEVYARGQFNADAGPGNNAFFGTLEDGNAASMSMFTWGAPGDPNLLQIASPNNLAGAYTAKAASFGPSITSTGVSGNLVLAEDATPDIYNACEPFINTNALNNQIAVIRRGICNFTSKVLQAQNAGAVGVIVVNNVNGPTINMGGNPSATITIPSIMIDLNTGSNLISNLENGVSIQASIKNDGPYQKDGSLDGGIIAHEYGHGISIRLTGGAGTADCLYPCEVTNPDGSCFQATEQMGEGWSDYVALMMTLKASDTRTDARGIATYVVNQQPGGTGIRPYAYSTDFSINPATYDLTNNPNLSAPHGVGFVWATMLWEMTWDFIDLYGFDPDIYNGTGGNNMAMQLVIDALKLQPCNPGFIDGRDAILQADMILNNGANQCLIWDAFARRGLGFSADQGNSLDRSDQLEAFDLPTTCTMGTTTPQQNLFQVYPNPTNGLLQLRQHQQPEAFKVQVFDVKGRLLLKQEFNAQQQTQVNLSSLNTGVYILQINTANQQQVEKLIIN